MDELFKDYLTNQNGMMPSNQSFMVYLMSLKYFSLQQASNALKEYKDLIYIYQTSWLQNQISYENRNSATYLNLLYRLQEENGVIADDNKVNITIDLPQTKQDGIKVVFNGKEVE